jgi:hypothetical protein
MFWLLVGAIGGIMGYRRAVAAARSVSGLSNRAVRTDRSEKSCLSRGSGLSAEPGRGEASAVRARRVRRGLIRGTISLGRGAVRLSRDARRFTRDVREGMDLYIARHPGPAGNTLAPSEDTNVKDGR